VLCNGYPESDPHRSNASELIAPTYQIPALTPKFLSGPRQSGKTTLLRHLFGDTCGYVSLELPDVRAAAIEDPRGFLNMHSPPVIFDEVQHAPNLLPYVKEQIDAARDRCGRYILTGSQNILLMEKVTEGIFHGHRNALLFSRAERPRTRRIRPHGRSHYGGSGPFRNHKDVHPSGN